MDQATPVYEKAKSGFEQLSQREGKIAQSIEKQTAKLPSDTFLWAAIGAMAASAVIQLLAPKRPALWGSSAVKGPLSLFIGQWAPTLLLFGIYNKIVKVAGSDRASR